jgi:hypothetical protein
MGCQQDQSDQMKDAKIKNLENELLNQKTENVRLDILYKKLNHRLKYDNGNIADQMRDAKIKNLENELLNQKTANVQLDILNKKLNQKLKIDNENIAIIDELIQENERLSKLNETNESITNDLLKHNDKFKQACNSKIKSESSDLKMDWQMSYKDHLNSDQTKNVYINNFFNNKTSYTHNLDQDNQEYRFRQVLLSIIKYFFYFFGFNKFNVFFLKRS